MFWQESNQENNFTSANNIYDAVFQISCSAIPVDHIYSLSNQITAILPWLKNEKYAGIHPIFIPLKAHGWQIPDGDDAIAHIPKRSKLYIRIEKQKLADLNILVGEIFNIQGNSLEILKALSPKKLIAHSSLFSRAIECNKDLSEGDFLEKTFLELKEIGIKPKKMLAGLESKIKLADDKIYTRSLMITDLRAEESITLQQLGLGSYKLLGCGIFKPQKNIG